MLKMVSLSDIIIPMMGVFVMVLVLSITLSAINSVNGTLKAELNITNQTVQETQSINTQATAQQISNTTISIALPAQQGSFSSGAVASPSSHSWVYGLLALGASLVVGAYVGKEKIFKKKAKAMS